MFVKSVQAESGAAGRSVGMRVCEAHTHMHTRAHWQLNGFTAASETTFTFYECREEERRIPDEKRCRVVFKVQTELETVTRIVLLLEIERTHSTETNKLSNFLLSVAHS